MKNKKGFTLVELIVSFALITAISLVFFKTILSLQQQQLENIARNNFKSFTIVLNNSIQKDFLNDNIEKIISCGENCYDITYTANGIVRLSVDKENGTITYGSIKEKLPNDYKFIGNIEFTSYINNFEGNDSYIALNLNLKSNYESKIENIKYLYQYDSDNGVIELDVDGAEASDIIEYLLYSSPEENGLYEPLLPDGTSTGIRYRGSNPNNYVYFNCEDIYNDITYGEENYDYENACEVWRIIGVFDVDNGKGNIEKRVKLVRNEAIGQRVFDGDNSQVWKQSDLQLYLNAETEESYYYSFSSNAKEQVNNAIWSTGLLKYNLKGTSPAEAYIQEKTIQNSESIVGLISVSDYGYSSDGNCIGIEFGTCAIDNWLKPEMRIWTIIPYFDYSYNIWYIDPGGGSNVNISSTIYLIQPSIYLKPNVTFIGDGIGTEDSPYILGINE